MNGSIRSRLARLRVFRGRNGERIAVWALVICVVAASGLALYFGFGLGGREASIEAVRANPDVSLTHENGVYALEPVDETARVGLVFYPGGRVSPDACLATLAPLASRAGVAVYVPAMPINLAVLDPDTADGVITRHPEIDRWIVGGHSLGGAMACRYVAGDAEYRTRVVGLLLFASYCDVDVRNRQIAVLSVTGSADSVLDRATYRRDRANLPANATLVSVQGMNHSEFGSYVGQPGDRPAPISYERAHDRLARVTVPWFGNRTAPRTNTTALQTGRTRYYDDPSARGF